jgi:prepilin-type N-terminal cleavage/methylation domain-containing protein
MARLPTIHAIRRRSPARGFTLIEILIVIAVILILASIAVVIGIGVQGASRERTTKATFKILDAAMSAFLKDHPEPTAANWVAALQAYPETASAISTKVSAGPPPVVLDGWGRPIQYVPSTAARKVGYFKSDGRDPANTADDLFSEGASATP